MARLMRFRPSPALVVALAALVIAASGVAIANADSDPDYIAHVMQPLSQGEGVAAFLVQNEDGDRSVLFCSHRLTGNADRIAHSVNSFKRAAQAVRVQQAARTEAQASGFRAIIA